MFLKKRRGGVWLSAPKKYQAALLKLHFSQNVLTKGLSHLRKISDWNMVQTDTRTVNFHMNWDLLGSMG